MKQVNQINPLTKEELFENLSDQKWRLFNLYWIKDKEGNTIPFRPNWAQLFLLDNLWYLNVILKARQLGITTFFCILWLDEVLFARKDSGLIAHKLTAAKKIFETKVRFAWEHLPKVIRDSYVVSRESANELKFDKDGITSSIYVGTSLRSGTVQRLHVSELGTISQHYPQKANEIITGAFNTVEKGQIITIESTAKGQSGYFYNICQKARSIQNLGTNKTVLDWQFFFFAWWKHPDYSLDTKVVIPTKMEEYFHKLQVDENIVLSPGQKAWYVKKADVQAEDMKREFPSTADEAFQASIEGSYYAKQMVRTEEQHRITSVPWIPDLPVSTWWDIGTATSRKDSCSIVFTQDVGLEIHVIDFYGNSGEGLAHYANILDKKPYRYAKHYAPHDIEHKEIGSGKTRLEIAEKLGLHFEVLPRLPFLDGIASARMIFNNCYFDAEKTDELLKALRSYRKEWDDKRGAYQDRPVKDWTTDPADAFRMMAIGHKEIRRLGNFDSEEEELRKIYDNDQQINSNDPFNPFAM